MKLVLSLVMLFYLNPSFSQDLVYNNIVLFLYNGAFVNYEYYMDNVTETNSDKRGWVFNYWKKEDERIINSSEDDIYKIEVEEENADYLLLNLYYQRDYDDFLLRQQFTLDRHTRVLKELSYGGENNSRSMYVPNESKQAIVKNICTLFSSRKIYEKWLSNPDHFEPHVFDVAYHRWEINRQDDFPLDLVKLWEYKSEIHNNYQLKSYCHFVGTYDDINTYDIYVSTKPNKVEHRARYMITSALDEKSKFIVRKKYKVYSLPLNSTFNTPYEEILQNNVFTSDINANILKCEITVSKDNNGKERYYQCSLVGNYEHIILKLVTSKSFFDQYFRDKDSNDTKKRDTSKEIKSMLEKHGLMNWR